MKAEELRIGNYVNCEQTTDVIVELNQNTCSVIWYKDLEYSNDYDVHSYEYIKPIPLTEEWLLKFGFEKENDYFDIHLKNEFLTIDLDCMDWHISENKRDYAPMDFWKDINYVHQLQNLYFALTGEEL